jgi:hypothetical protein
VRQLNPCARTLPMQKFDDPPQTSNVIVFPEPKVLRRNTAFGKYSRGLGKN